MSASPSIAPSGSLSGSLSVSKTLSGKEILVTGFSGFLAKVLVIECLVKVPEIKQIHLVLRSKGKQSAHRRFDEMLNSSPAFLPLRKIHGDGFAAFMVEKITVHEGDVSLPYFGLEDEVLDDFQENLDAVLHVAGLTDFQSDPRDAYPINVLGAEHAAELAASCDRAVLLHTSTCYVTGQKEGFIEEVHHSETPKALSWDIHSECHFLEALQDHEGDGTIEGERTARKVRREACMKRAKSLGFTNTYTYTKALAEALLQDYRKPDEKRRALPISIVRPAIIECAKHFPFPGWNEGINTSGPLIWLCQSYYRHFLCKEGLPFDVIPVDMVTRSMLAIAAALIEGQAEDIYQIGTSNSNLLTIDRALELTNLAIRRDFLQSEDKGKRRFQRLFDSVPTKSMDHALAPDKLMHWARQLEGSLRSFRMKDLVPFEHPLLQRIDQKRREATTALRSLRKGLRQIDKLFEIYKPFIYEHHWIFSNQAIHRLDTLLDADSKADFGWLADGLDWRVYWLNEMYPGIAKWCLPLLEGKEPPEAPPLSAAQQEHLKSIRNKNRTVFDD